MKLCVIFVVTIRRKYYWLGFFYVALCVSSVTEVVLLK
jgi:hypothetical protein